METASGRRGRWWARAFHALGFQWRFWWTLPIPYHPLIPALCLLVPPVLLVAGLVQLAEGRPSPVPWTAFLFTGLALVVPLSLPLFNMIFILLRVQFLQGLCFTAAMALLAAEVAAGRAEPWLAVLPTIYFGAFAIMLVWGRVQLARVERVNAAYRPLPIDGRPLAVEGTQMFTATGDLLGAGVANIICCGAADTNGSAGLAGNSAIRLAEADAARFSDALKEKALRPPGWHMISARAVQLPGRIAEPEVAITLLPRKWRALSLHGKEAVVTDRGDTRRVTIGWCAPVMPLPMFFLFYVVAWTGGRSHWMADWWRAKSRRVGPPEAQATESRLTGLFAPPTEPLPPADAAPIVARLEHDLGERIAAARAELVEAMAGRTFWPTQAATLKARPEALAGLGETLCDWLQRLKTERKDKLAVVAAELIALLDPAEFARIEASLLPLLGSRILALRWEVTPELDRRPLPRDCPLFERGRFAGFGLMEAVPQFWARMGELGPDAATITAKFLGEVGERPPLVAAREGFTRRRMWPPLRG